MDNQLVAHPGELVARIEMGPTHVQNETILESEDNVPDSELLSSRSTRDFDEPNDGSVQMFDEEDNADGFKRAVEDGLIISLTLKAMDKTLPLQLTSLSSWSS